MVNVFLATMPDVAVADDPEPVFYYYHADHLGSSSIMTDRDGELVQHYTYKAFGYEQYTYSSITFSVTNHYTGQELDEDTGLYYYGARYYDPEIGRFIQPDSIVPGMDSSQNFNRYSYCVNNPLKYIDPAGYGMVDITIPAGINNSITVPSLLGTVTILVQLVGTVTYYLFDR